MHLSRKERNDKESLFEIGYEYLRKNFSKFNQRDKIKIALEVVKIRYAKGLEEQKEMPPIIIEIENENIVKVEPLEVKEESGEGISS